MKVVRVAPEVKSERLRVLRANAPEARADRSSVGRHLQAIEQAWRTTPIDYGTARGRQFAQIRRMLREARAMYRQSKAQGG